MARLDCKKEVVPFTAMASVECISVILNTLYKAAAAKGLSYFVYVTYSYALGALVYLPLLFIFPRTGLPPLKPSILYRILLLSVIGYAGNICIFKGIEYSSPTLASAISNLQPAFTFVLAVIFRMEKLDLGSSSTRAKTIGTILSVSGALIAILYDGPVILSSSSPSSLEYPLQTPETNWILGGLLLVAFCILVSVWYILQTHVIKLYPAEVTVVVLFSLCTSIIAAAVCFIVETDTSAWRLRTDLALPTIVLYGLFGPTFTATVHTWGLHLKGPVYVTIFRPIAIVIAAAMGVMFLGDVLHLGSAIGAMILLVGFYGVIWGKANEETMSKDSASADHPGASPDGEHLLRS
ncbi:WAT1-related protein At5g40240 [Morus notabilis]|nr:WAT1-related protein At5g40240 [Morus notabilis]